MTMITLDTYHKLMNNMFNRSVKVIEMLDCSVKGLFIFYSLYCVIKLITFYTRNYILSSSVFFFIMKLISLAFSFMNECLVRESFEFL